MRKQLALIVFLMTNFLCAQNTDLAITVEAKNNNNIQVSQVHIYESFYYLVTITNSGSAVTNATFSQTINSSVSVIDYQSQNALGGAANATDLSFSGNTLTGTLPNMPTAASVQIRLNVYAPTNPGGISTTTTVTPPDGTTDTNPGSNQSIISTNVYEVPIDFSIVHSQTSPPEGTGISAWGNSVTYQFTITNENDFTFPIDEFSTRLYLASDPIYGSTLAELNSISCIGTTGGLSCPDLPDVSGEITNITGDAVMYNYIGELVFPAGATISFQLTYTYTEGNCTQYEDAEDVAVNSIIDVNTPNNTYQTFSSNSVTTDLLGVTYCPCTDVEIENTIIAGLTGGALASWDDTITIETTVTNNGPEDTSVSARLQNLLAGYVDWNIISVSCDATGNIDCSSIVYNYGSNGQIWITDYFDMAVGESITFETVVEFYPPDCATSNPIMASINAMATVSTIDCEPANNQESITFILPDTDICENADISVTKTQTAPVLPVGGSASTPTPWEEVTYEIVIENITNADTYFEFKEYFNFVTPAVTPQYTGTLISVDCIGTTGDAECQPITNAYIGVENDSVGDLFFEITPEENWFLPGNSSITLEMVIEWVPNCDITAIPVATKSLLSALDPVVDGNSANNSDITITYFTPCVDLIVQTYPSSPTVSVDSNFNWVVDISNSSNSSTAIDATFSTLLNSAMIINGTPTCSVTQGNATCATAITINGNEISGTIPMIEPGASIQIIVPTLSPDYGGSFDNTAEAFPDIFNNGEITPDTNISISSVQVLAPKLEKSFVPEEIQTGQSSTLTFTIQNITGNPEQFNISFTDNLPNDVTLIDAPQWVNANNATADFTGDYGDNFVGVTNLYMPEGTETCSFAVNVTSMNSDFYINLDSNFGDRYNIETTNTYATLTVTENPDTELDLAISKAVNTEHPQVGEIVTFTITVENLSNVFASAIEISEMLPAGYEFVSYTATSGSYDEAYWTIPILYANESATLTIMAMVTDIEDYLNTASITALNEVDMNATNNTAQASVSPLCFDIYNGVSPDGDLRNDTFVIECIDYYTGNNLKIYNRYGLLVFEQDDYDNTWSGLPNRGPLKNANQLLPVGTYYYIVTVPDNPTLTGWLYLNY